MVIFKYELKRHRKYILGWAIALALCVFLMTPTYYSFMDVSTGDLYETLGTSDFYKGVGVSMEYLTSPLGIYAFLTSFFMIASGIFGMHFGIAIHTKECSERTSEYLFTKPHTRKTIYWAKAFTVFFGVVVVSMVYLLASFLALALFRSGIDWGEFFLIALSLMLVTLFLAAMGLLVGILFSRNRSPLLTAGLIVFVEYCVTSFSNIVSNRAISFLSPYSFFSAAEISKSGFYELDYLGWCVLLFALFLVLSYRVFLKKDIQFRSCLLIWLGIMLLLCGFCYFELLSLKDSLDEMARTVGQFPRLIMIMFGVKGDLTTALGWYACIYFWEGLLAFAYAISLGLSCVAREKKFGTSEYLFTKPVERKTIVLAKVIVSSVNLLVFSLFSGVCNYFAVILPMGGLEQPGAGTATVVGMFLTQLLFFALGLLFASLFKSYKAAVRVGTVFVLAAYAVAITAEYAGNRFLDYLTPLRYYDVYEVALNGVYLSSIVLTVLIVGACVMVSTRRWKLREL